MTTYNRSITNGSASLVLENLEVGTYNVTARTIESSTHSVGTATSTITVTSQQKPVPDIIIMNNISVTDGDTIINLMFTNSGNILLPTTSSFSCDAEDYDVQLAYHNNDHQKPFLKLIVHEDYTNTGLNTISCAYVEDANMDDFTFNINLQDGIIE